MANNEVGDGALLELTLELRQARNTERHRMCLELKHQISPRCPVTTSDLARGRKTTAYMYVY